jgi:hypothetical protein
VVTHLHSLEIAELKKVPFMPSIAFNKLLGGSWREGKGLKEAAAGNRVQH